MSLNGADVIARADLRQGLCGLPGMFIDRHEVGQPTPRTRADEHFIKARARFGRWRPTAKSWLDKYAIVRAGVSGFGSIYASALAPLATHLDAPGRTAVASGRPWGGH
jgi:hypothetical protein